MPDILTVDVVDVTDGDTLTVEGSAGEAVTVRLWGIDAPETSQPFGPEATAVARQEAEGKRVEVEVVDQGSYGRLIGRVHVGGTTLGRTLTRSGYAWHARRHGTSGQLKENEREARRNRRGLWSQGSPTPPWEHRNGTGGSAVEGAMQLFAWALATIVILVLLILLSA